MRKERKVEGGLMKWMIELRKVRKEKDMGNVLSGVVDECDMGRGWESVVGEVKEYDGDGGVIVEMG